MSANQYYTGQTPGNQQASHTDPYRQGQATYPDHTQTSGASQWQDTSNPYGYPASNNTQPYYGQSDYNQSQGYNQQYSHPSDPNQQHQPPVNSSAQYGNYDDQYNAPPQQSYQQYSTAYPGADQYGSGYSNQAQHTSYQQATPHDPYAYDTARQQGYDYNAQSQIPPDPSIVAAKVDPNDPNMAEGERGLMGALAGGAAGAYGGHKIGHGFIGAIGGAVAGSKLEDHFKEKKKEEKKEKKNRERRSRDEHRSRRHGSRSSSSSSSSSSSDSDGHKKKRKHRKPKGAAVGGAAALSSWGGSSRDAGSGYNGNFSASSSNITLDRDYDLIALCANVDGKEKLSSIDLKDILSNDRGDFRWSRRGGALAGARHVRLVSGGRVLEAELDDGRGNLNLSRITLDERISNEDGNLVFLDR